MLTTDPNYFTDCWRGCAGACDYVREHQTVNYTLGFINHDNGVYTNTIEGNWSAIKALIPRRYRNKKCLSTWLQYFMFKKNVNGDCMLNFIKLLE
ncbi:BTB And C-terminal Kelch [Conglomerata obtusa]